MSDANFIIPLRGTNELFAVALNGISYSMVVIWRDDPGGQGGWMLDIYDSQNDPILQGIPFVTGADLLAQYEYLGFGGSLYVQNDLDTDATPTFTNLGTDCNLYWVTPTP